MSIAMQQHSILERLRVTQLRCGTLALQLGDDLQFALPKALSQCSDSLSNQLRSVLWVVTGDGILQIYCCAL